MTSLLVLVILAVVWAGVLLPPYLRNRGQRTSDSILSFRQQLTTLERTGPLSPWRGTLPPTIGRSLPAAGVRPAALPLGRRELKRRRRDILLTLVGAAVVTLVLAVALGGMAIWFHLIADALVGGYVFLLVQIRRGQAERQAKVRYLGPPTAVPEPALLRRRA